MKIKRIDTIAAVIALNNNYTFTQEMYTIEYLRELNAFRVKGVTIPMANVRDFVFEEEVLEPTKLTPEEGATAKALPEDDVMTHSNQIEGRVQVSPPAAASLSTVEESRPEETVTKSKTKVKKS